MPVFDPKVYGRYVISPLENAEEKHFYTAQLTILDSTISDEEYTYTLKVQRHLDDDEDEPVLETVNYE